MTIASTLSKKHYQGNDIATEFPLPFQVAEKGHIFAVIKKGMKIEEVKTNFTVDLNRRVFIYPLQGEPLKTGEYLTLYRKIPLTQIVDLENAGAFHPKVLEHDGFDRIVMQIQQLDEEISRALKIDITDTRDVSNLLEELFAARDEAVSHAQKASEQANLSRNHADTAETQAENAETWALFAKEKAEQLTDLQVECYISNDGKGQITYHKEENRLEIVLPFDNAGLHASKVSLTDKIDLERSDIGASAKALTLLDAKTEAALAEKIDKSAISSAIDSVSEETVASSKAVSGLRNVLSDSFISGLGMPNLDKKIFIQFSPINNDKIDYSAAYTAPANGWVTVYGQVANIASKAYALVVAQSGDIRMTSASGTADVVCTATIPVRKGRGVYLKTQSCWSVGAYFFYAQGES